MKRKHKNLLFAVCLVAVAVIASQIQSAIRAGDGESDLSVVSEVSPAEIAAAEPSPVSAPTLTPAPLPAAAPSVSSSPTPEEDASSTAAPDVPDEAPLHFLLPAEGTESLGFSDKTPVYFEKLREWRCHTGIDFIPNRDNDAVTAACGGTVSAVYDDVLYGKTVSVKHREGLYSLYASLGEIYVSEGDTVKAGDKIGRMGDSAAAESGIHLHFAIQKDGKNTDPFAFQ